MRQSGGISLGFVSDQRVRQLERKLRVSPYPTSPPTHGQAVEFERGVASSEQISSGPAPSPSAPPPCSGVIVVTSFPEVRGGRRGVG